MTRLCFNGIVSVSLFATCLWLVLGKSIVSSESIGPVQHGDGPNETTELEKLAFASQEVELGAIKGATECRFQYFNRSSANVAVLSPAASCACTLSKPDKPTLAPGESGFLTVAFDAATEKPGTQTHIVRFNYLGQVRRQAILSVRFTNTPDILVPDRIELLTWTAHPDTRMVTITDYRETPLDITRVESTLENVRVAVVEKATRYAPGWGFKVRVDAEESKVMGDQAGRLILHTTDSARPRIEIALAVRHVQRIRVLPARLRLAGSPGGNVFRGRLWLDDLEGKNIVIDSIESSDAGLECQWEHDGRQKHVVDVRFDASRGVAEKPLKLHIRIKDPLVCLLDVDVSLPS